ncbi:MAG: inositol 2-dehydrogenase [Hyphomicrobiales bacterium]|nr:MAG: inositol 2-dehydrogenase [Hyphomicrobiales bacterium]
MTDLRIAVLGVGLMGADHVDRITNKISGARVAAVSDRSPQRAHAVAHNIEGCQIVDDPFDAIASTEIDAVILSTPGEAHEKQVHACLDHRKPVLCEKPLTTEASSALGIVEREAGLGIRLIQVGFMRRFDHEYIQLESLLTSGQIGQPLLAHCIHRNRVPGPNFTSESLITDSLVHEADVTRFLFKEEITTVQIIKPTASAGAPPGLQDPQIALFRTESGRHIDVEVFVGTGVGYEVRTEVVGEFGSATVGHNVGLIKTGAPGTWGGNLTPTFLERFSQAYTDQLQRWVNAIRKGPTTGDFTDGPTAADGYAAAAVCSAAKQSLRTGQPVEIVPPTHETCR